MAEPTFELWRILGNDLPPRHSERQTLVNTRFLLEHEPPLTRCRKRWLLNRIVDPAAEAELIALLRAHDQPFERIPFERERYEAARYDPRGLPEAQLRGDPPLTDYLKVRASEYPFRHKSAYATNNNGARNHAVAASRAAGATWALPWDGACVVRPDAWEELLAAAADPATRYLVVPMARFDRNEDALDPEALAEAVEEPQIAFHRDAAEVFDPNLRYGFDPKVELLRRLRIPGVWDGRPEVPWERLPVRFAADADRAVRAGWVGRLSSGAPEVEAQGAARFRARISGIVTFVDQLDRARVTRSSHPRDLAVYDGALLTAAARAGADARAVPLVARARAIGPAPDRAAPWAERWSALVDAAVTMTLAGAMTRDPALRRQAATRVVAATTGPAALPAAPPPGLDRRTLATLLAPLPAFCDAVRILTQTGDLPREPNRAVRAWADGLRRALRDSALGIGAEAYDDAAATAYDVFEISLAGFVGRPDALLAAARAATRRAALQFGPDGLLGSPRERLGVIAGWTLLARYDEIVGEPLWNGLPGSSGPASAALDLLGEAGSLPPDAVAALRHLAGLPSADGERLARQRGDVPEVPILQPWWWARVPAPAPRFSPAPP